MPRPATVGTAWATAVATGCFWATRVTGRVNLDLQLRDRH